MPLGAAIDGANRNDHKLMRQTLEAIPVERPKPSASAPQNLCLDEGYDYREPRALADEFAFTLHLRTRGEEIQAKRHAQAKARRWVVEVVFTQMAKADVLALRAGGQDVTNLDLGIGDNHAVDQEQHELAALLEAGLGQSTLHPLAECLQRCCQADELPLAFGVVA